MLILIAFLSGTGLFVLLAGTQWLRRNPQFAARYYPWFEIDHFFVFQRFRTNAFRSVPAGGN
jgi:hypothetical protein